MQRLRSLTVLAATLAAVTLLPDTALAKRKSPLEGKPVVVRKLELPTLSLPNFTAVLGDERGLERRRQRLDKSGLAGGLGAEHDNELGEPCIDRRRQQVPVGVHVRADLCA